ncbi:hypothetical protein [Fimbriiglobus ruber]|uniref:Uncharacterized protein n=1 Tax=Fimbriiglobus ruber TaxID=1908690 RepID=A0A225DSM1_9BACT|nr:hypothetical protein [Fimbriiglobus ruber]OWK44480.1 hypothetical protein FRUB_02412 [Fimbriiglobus ruber]
MRHTLSFATVTVIIGLAPLAGRCDDPIPVVVSAPPVQAVDLTGRWSGYWISDKNGHQGPLNGTFEKVSCDQYRVRFTGRFWKVFPFLYSVKLNVVENRGDTVILAGETKLGPVMGTFRYDVTASANNFEARFTSKGDHGRFVLSR